MSWNGINNEIYIMGMKEANTKRGKTKFAKINLKRVKEIQSYTSVSTQNDE